MTNLYVITDSYGQQSPSLFATMAARLGWTITTLDAVGGSGYTTASSFGSRCAAAVAAAPDVVMVGGSINDKSASIASVVTAAQAAWASLAAIPIVIAAFFAVSDSSVNGPTALGPLAAALAVGAATSRIRFVSGVGWITGTGQQGSPTGVGNGDVYAQNDGGHPSIPAGAAYLGVRLAMAISAPSTGLDF